MRAGTQLRNRLSLTQSAMSELLGISRSVYALYETGKRELPVAAFSKMADIEVFLNSPHSKKAAPHPHLKNFDKKVGPALKKFAKEQAYRKAVAEQKLATIQKAYDQKIELLSLIGHLNNNLDKPANKRTMNLLKLIEREALHIMDRNGLDKQAVLKSQISAYAAGL